jgi:hypothetical protein
LTYSPTIGLVHHDDPVGDFERLVDLGDEDECRAAGGALRIYFPISRRAPISTPWNGSSSRSTRAVLGSQRPIMTFC